MTSPLIEKLVEIRGIESHYTDAWGNPATVKEESKGKLLKAMGYEIDDPEALQKQVNEEVSNAWLSPLNPVQVNRVGDELFFTVRLPIELVNDKFVLSVNTESGEVIEQTFTPSEGELINVNHLDEVEFQEYLIKLDAELPLGYHQLNLLADDEDKIADMRLIIAPMSCYHPSTIKQGNKVWGLSVQLYCLRSEKNWGVGDFSDLSFLLENAAQNGAQFVGLNPIHALYPADPDACSPYGPFVKALAKFHLSGCDGNRRVRIQSSAGHCKYS